MRHTTPRERLSLPPCDPPSVRFPRVDFKVGCRCSTCSLAILIPATSENLTVEYWHGWWWRVLAFRLWRNQGNDAICCRWQLWSLSEANDGAAPRALAARLDVAGDPGPIRRGDQSLFSPRGGGGASN